MSREQQKGGQPDGPADLAMPDLAMPETVKPMNALTSEKLPSNDEGWAYEIKFDGYRIISFVQDGQVRLQTRNLLNATDEFPEVAGLGSAVGSHRVILDGEVVAFDAGGRPSFGALQRRGKERPPVVYMVFDLLYLDGRPTMQLPYMERRKLLAELDVASGPSWQVPNYHLGDGALLLETTRAQGLEGLIAKRLDSIYEPGRRSREWLKIKNWGRQEFVIGGWLPGEGGRSGHVGSLLLGYYDGGALRYAGRVGTGFTAAELARLEQRLQPLATETVPFYTEDQPLPPEVRRFGRFVEPVLVAEVAFSEWTHTGTVRQPSYKGLRTDKDPTEVVREA
jgi:bifunctional non-homologous end joining protein LigD